MTHFWVYSLEGVQWRNDLGLSDPTSNLVMS